MARRLLAGAALGAAMLLTLGPTASAMASGSPPESIAYSTFRHWVADGRIAAVVISGQRIRGTLKDRTRFVTVSPAPDDAALIDALLRERATVSGEPADSGYAAEALPMVTIGVLLLGAALYAVHLLHERNRAAVDRRDLASLRRCGARRFEAGPGRISFSDVAGVEEAKQELAEIVEFLRCPAKYRSLGGRIPRGVLMAGPPGTGKTLLAKAIAGEAGVPFFAMAGSEFVEMYAGVGASRVRDLFGQARSAAPCIVFIDEIDAVGSARAAHGAAGNDERDQTLNQLLVEMDGFEGNAGVIVIAATNRPDMLDRALLRPGRFDRQVSVPLPDLRGREQIVRVHLRRVPLARDVDPAAIARGAAGFSGADLAQLVNEAALGAARSDKAVVEQADFERARDRIMMGAERRSLALSEQDRRVAAYHEAGHAIVGLALPEHDPLYRASIAPRGHALGQTMFVPESERYSQSRESLRGRMACLLGGRVAEELAFGADGVTNTAADDLERATQIARTMVARYGMSNALGPQAYALPEARAGAGRADATAAGLSRDTARAIDREVRQVVERSCARAREILLADVPALHRVAQALLQHESLTSAQIRSLLEDPGASQARSGPEQAPSRPEVP